jgi:hypothetical protein
MFVFHGGFETVVSESEATIGVESRYQYPRTDWNSCSKSVTYGGWRSSDDSRDRSGVEHGVLRARRDGTGEVEGAVERNGIEQGGTAVGTAAAVG